MACAERRKRAGFPNALEACADRARDCWIRLDPLRGVKARQVAVGVDQAAPANGSGARPAAVPKNLKRRRSDSAECCEAVRRCRFSRDQMGSEIFGDEIGRSEPDGRVLQAEAGGPSSMGPGADQGPPVDHLGGVAGPVWRPRRRGDLALLKSTRAGAGAAVAFARNPVET